MFVQRLFQIAERFGLDSLHVLCYTNDSEQMDYRR
jgi:hypothetical protein